MLPSGVAVCHGDRYPANSRRGPSAHINVMWRGPDPGGAGQFRFDKVLTGSHGGNSIPDEDIPRLIKLINSNKMTLNGIVTHEFKLEEINDALDLFRKGSSGRIIINMNK